MQHDSQSILNYHFYDGLYRDLQEFTGLYVETHFTRNVAKMHACLEKKAVVLTATREKKNRYWRKLIHH